MSILYLLPIGLTTWFGGLGAGVLVSFAAAWLWFMVDDRAYSRLFIPYWNAIVRMGFFLLTAFLLNRVRLLTTNLEALIRKRTAELVSEVEQRERAVAVLQESELRFRQLAENIREVFWISDPEKMKILYVSPAYEMIWGRPCASLYLAPQEWMEAIHPDDRTRVREAALSKQVTGEYDEVYRILQPDGTIRWVHDRAFPVKEPDGSIYRIVGIAEEITGRKESEEQLAMLAQALESTAELICITDLEGRCTYGNRAFQTAFGYTAEEVIGKRAEMLYSPNNPPALMAEIMEQTRRGGWQGEVVDQRKDGSEFPVFLSTSQIRNRADEVIGLIGVSRDITEIKRAEKQSTVFASLGYKLSGANQSAEAAQIIMDMASELFGWDAGYLHLYSPEEDRIVPILTMDTVNKRREPVVPSSFTLDPSPLMRRVMESGAQLINRLPEVPLPVPLVPFGDTGRRSASMMHVPIHSSASVLGVLSIQSYTPHAYSAEDLKLLQALADHCGDALHRIKLAVATRELAAIVENSGDAIISKTLDGRIVSWNKAAERLYGYTAGEIKGRSISVLIPPERQDELPAIQNLIAREEWNANVETTCIRKEGARIEVSLTFSPIRDEAARITGVSVIARDITERKRLEHEIAGVSHHEQQRLAHDLHDHLGAYFAGVAFRAKALADSLGSRAVPEAAEALGLVKLVNDGVNQVRNFARLLAPVELANGGLASGLALLASEMESFFGITCLVEVARDLPALNDEQSLQLYRIAQEAARNAAKHGNARLLRIAVDREPDYLKLIVRNDGAPWIPPDEPTRSLGLRIMRYRAGTLGGTLTFRVEPDQSTAVVCQIPLPNTA